jgi:hypothetical protein
MRSITVHKWQDRSGGALTEEAIRAKHQPPEAYRISRSEYPAGTSFQGTMRPGLIYVLRGACSIDCQGKVTANAGECVAVPGGDYEFAVIGPDGADIVEVWLIPYEVRVRRSCNLP